MTTTPVNAENKNPPSHPTLEHAMLAIQQEIGDTVDMSGYNKHAEYSYSTDTDYIKHVRTALNKHGIRITLGGYELLETADQNKVKGYVTFQISHPESGQKIERRILAEANDKQDKAVPKFITAARKMLFRTEFMLGSDETEDTSNTTTNSKAGSFDPKGFIIEVRDSLQSARSVSEVNAIWTLRSSGFKSLATMDRNAYDTLLRDLGEAKKKLAEAEQASKMQKAAPPEATAAPVSSTPPAAPAPAAAPEASAAPGDELLGN